MQIEGVGGAAGTGQADRTLSPRLVRAAHEFEGQMMKELLKPMTDGDPLTGAADSSAEPGSQSALNEFAGEVMGRALSEHGGLGIADRIVRELAGNQSGH